MKARSTVLLTTAVAGVILLWVAISASWSKEKTNARLDEARNTQARLEGRWREAEQALVARVAKTISPTEATKAAAPTGAQSAPGPRPAAPGFLDIAYNDPQLMNLFITSKKSELQQRYVALFQRLNLTAADRDAFKAILSAGIARGIDLAAASHARGLPQTDPVFVKLREDSDRQTDTELASLLGVAGLAEFKDFNRTTTVRRFVDGFASQLGSSEPLQPAQAEQLARTLANASSAYRKGGSAVTQGMDWAAVDREAPTYLTRGQLAAWDLRVAQNKAELQLEKIYDAASARSGTAPGSVDVLSGPTAR